MNCRTCRFWSDMVAHCIDGGPVEAMCLSPDGPRARKFVTSHIRCPAWKDDGMGKVDEPGEDPSRYAEPGEPAHV